MNIFDLNDLDESHATSQDLDEHARNRCDAQWFFLFQFVASDAGVCSQCLKIAVDLMWILGPLEVVNITMQVFLWQKVFGYHPWSYLYYWTILTDAGSDVCMVPVQRRQNSLCFCGAPCQTVEKKTATANTANATFFSPSSGVYLFWWFFDVFFLCFDGVHMFWRFVFDGFLQKERKALWDCEKDESQRPLSQGRATFQGTLWHRSPCEDLLQRGWCVGHRWSVLEIMGNIWMWDDVGYGDRWIAPRSFFVSNQVFWRSIPISHIQI